MRKYGVVLGGMALGRCLLLTGCLQARSYPVVNQDAQFYYVVNWMEDDSGRREWVIRPQPGATAAVWSLGRPDRYGRISRKLAMPQPGSLDKQYVDLSLGGDTTAAP